MQKRKIYVLAGLLLCSISAFAQSEKKSIAVDRKNQVALPVGPALPGEEHLSAQERAERDFLMPTRRKKATAATTKVEEAQQAALEVTAHNLEAVEATEAEEAAPAVKKTVTHHSAHRSRAHSSTHRTTTRSSSSKRKTTSKSHSTGTKSKHVTKKPAAKKRRR